MAALLVGIAISSLFYGQARSFFKKMSLFNLKTAVEARAEGELAQAVLRLTKLISEPGYSHPVYGPYVEPNYTAADPWLDLFESTVSQTGGYSGMKKGYIWRFQNRPIEQDWKTVDGIRTGVDFAVCEGDNPTRYRVAGAQAGGPSCPPSPPSMDVNHDGADDPYVYILKLRVTSEDAKGSRAVIEQEMVFGAIDSSIFKYALLAKRVKECQLCHADVRGKIGEVASGFGRPISYHGLDAKFESFVTAGEFRLWDHPGSPRREVTSGIRTLLTTLEAGGAKVDIPKGLGEKYNGPLIGKIRQMVSDPVELPQSWPSILRRVNPANGLPATAAMNDASNPGYPASMNNHYLFDPFVVKAATARPGTITPYNGAVIYTHDGAALPIDKIETQTPWVGGGIFSAGAFNGNVIIDARPYDASGAPDPDAYVEICGNLVIRGDLIIRGRIKTRGCLNDTSAIYVARNIYIVGDLTYQSANANSLKYGQSNWWCATNGMKAYELTNGVVDLLFLYAGGNVIVGTPAALTDAQYLAYNTNYESSGVIPDPSQADYRGTMNFIRTGAMEGIDLNNDGKVLAANDLATGFYVMDGRHGTRSQTIFSLYPNRTDSWEDHWTMMVGSRSDSGTGAEFYRPGVKINTTGLLPAGAEFMWRGDSSQGDEPDPKGWVNALVWGPNTGWITQYAFLQLAVRPDDTGTPWVENDPMDGGDDTGLNEFLHDTGYYRKPVDPLNPADPTEIPWAGIANNVSRIEAFIFTDGLLTGHKQSAEGLNIHFCGDPINPGWYNFDPTMPWPSPPVFNPARQPGSAERYGYTGDASSNSCRGTPDYSNPPRCNGPSRRYMDTGAFSEGGQDNYGTVTFSGLPPEGGDIPETCAGSAQPAEPDGITILGGAVARDIDFFAPGGFYVCYDDRMDRIDPLSASSPGAFPAQRFVMPGKRN